MPDINQTITTNFQDNVSYFEKNHPQLFSKLSALDSAIANGYYQEKYELVYENNGFDVFERSSNIFLYNKESLAHTLISTNSINFKSNENLFEGFHRYNFSQEDISKYEQNRPMTSYLSDIAPLIYSTQSHYKEEKLLKTIDKFIFFGVGLGLHLSSIHQKIHAKVYLIIEDDLELFRLSLFTTNYKQISQDSILIFSVFENNNEFMNTSAEFLNMFYYYNHYLKYYSLLSHSQEKQEQFLIAITSQPHIRYNFSNQIKSNLAPLQYLVNGYKVLNKSLNLSKKYFEDMPFILIAMGPSLEKEIEWLKKNHNNLIVVAVSSSLSYLEKNAIAPDIIVHVDPFEWGIKSFEKLKNLNFIRNSLFFCSMSTPKNITSLFEKNKLYLFETATNYKKSAIKSSTPCVGSATYQLLLLLNINTIYLLGLDLAVDTKTGKTHSQSHQSIKVLKINDEQKSKKSISYKDSLFEVSGNRTTVVLTTANLYTSIYTIDYFSKILHDENKNVVNLGDGAKFIHTTAKKTNNLKIKPIQQKKEINDKLQELCDKHSSSIFMDSEIKNLKKYLAHANNLKSYLENRSKPKKSDFDFYFTSLCDNLTSHQDLQTYELSRVLDSYLKYTLGYIYDFFNSQLLNINEDELINLDEILKKHLIKIIKFYQEELNKALK